MVVLGAFFALMMEMGIVQTLGVFVVPLEEEFESGAAVMGMLASSCFATLCAACKYMDIINSGLETEQPSGSIFRFNLGDLV